MYPYLGRVCPLLVKESVTRVQATSFALEALQCDPKCVQQEKAAMAKRHAPQVRSSNTHVVVKGLLSSRQLPSRDLRPYPPVSCSYDRPRWT